MKYKIVVIVWVILFLGGRWLYADGEFVNDKGRFFNDTTRQLLNSKNQELQSKTGKAVYILTLPALEGKSAQEVIARYFSEHKINGVLIFLSKKEHILRMRVGDNTAKFFNRTAANMAKERMVFYFKKGDFNQGILAGYQIIETSLLAGLPAGAAAKSAPAKKSSSNDTFKWIVIVLFIFLGMGVVRWLGSRFSVTGGTPGSPGTPGAPAARGTGGGGFWSGLLGGLGGALLGNYLYDSFSNRSDGSRDFNTGADASAGQAENHGMEPDRGVGFDVEGDWGSGDQVADSGFDSGGDFGGGGDW
jgi:uncharacterized membrane protein YgcG